MAIKRADLTKVDGTIGKVFLSHRDQLLNESTNIEDIRSKVSKLFADNHINTPKSRMIQLKLTQMSFSQGLMYIQNIIFKSANLSVY